MSERVQQLSWVAPLGSVVFFFVTIYLGALSDGYALWDVHIVGYSWVAQPISGLGLGRTAVWMNLAFVALGIAVACLASFGCWARWVGRDVRLARWACGTLVSGGIGTGLCGIFTLESMAGHSIGFLLILSPIATLPRIAWLLGGVAAGSRLRARPVWLLWSLGLLLTVVFVATFDPASAGQNEGAAGLTQRALVAWVMVVWGVLAFGPRGGTAAALTRTLR